MVLLLAALLQDDPTELARRLGTGTDEERWAAVEAIAKVGESARAAASKCPDGWWRGAALAELDARRDGGAAWKDPVRVTLAAKDQALGDVLRALSEQAHVSIQTTSVDRRVTLNLDGDTWFESLRELWLAADTDIQRGRDGSWVCEPPEDSRKYTFLHRSFEVAALDLELVTTSDFRDAPRSELRLGLAVRGDPSVRVLTISTPRVAEAVDDTGRSLRHENSELPKEAATRSVRDLSARGCNLRLEVPAAGATKISRLRGSIRVRLAKALAAVSFDKLAATGTAEKEISGLKIKIGPHVRRGDREFTTQLAIEAPGEGYEWPEAQEIRLADSADVSWIFRRHSRNVTSTGVSYHLTWRNPGGSDAPASLSFSVVTERYERDLFFEIKDIPLR